MSSKLVRFAYFGLPLGALALARAGFTPHLIVLGHTDAPGARRVRKLPSRLLERPDLRDAHVQRSIRDAGADALLCWFYPKQVPRGLLDAFPRGAFGTHPSLLPRWRGPDPYFWAIYEDDRETGVSLHRLEADYDTGAVIAQEALAIDPREHAFRLAKRLDRPALRLLVDCARRLSNGEPLHGRAQPAEGVTLAPKPEPELLELDWEAPAAQVVRLVRAAAPYPGASCELGSEVVDVLEAEVYGGALPRALEPRDAVWTPDGLVVCAGDAGVLVRRVRTERDVLLHGSELTRLFPGGLTQVHFGPKDPS
ncbi:MAG TPA: formyltransferase family protein [Polyangiales bacterium]|nr:formyltransferase family protein [Polyangiales bacterium]